MRARFAGFIAGILCCLLIAAGVIGMSVLDAESSDAATTWHSISFTGGGTGAYFNEGRYPADPSKYVDDWLATLPQDCIIETWNPAGYVDLNIFYACP